MRPSAITSPLSIGLLSGLLLVAGPGPAAGQDTPGSTPAQAAPPTGAAADPAKLADGLRRATRLLGTAMARIADVAGLSPVSQRLTEQVECLGAERCRVGDLASLVIAVAPEVEAALDRRLASEDPPTPQERDQMARAVVAMGSATLALRSMAESFRGMDRSALSGAQLGLLSAGLPVLQSGSRLASMLGKLRSLGQKWNSSPTAG
jgi:hypothetical protein